MKLQELLVDQDTQRIKFGVVDVDGILRGKIIHKSKIEHGTTAGFCNVIFGWDMQDRLYENTPSSTDSGFRDEMTRIDLSSGRRLAWDDDTPFFFGDFRDAEGISATACPRTLLFRVLQKYAQRGLHPMIGPEYEWFNFRETPDSLQSKHFQDLQPITPGMFGYSLQRLDGSATFASELFDLLSASNIPIEGLHTETGPGAYEACIKYSDALEAADRAVLFKLGVKAIGHRHGIIPTFMAKWTNDLPGCSGHIHQSLWREGQNCFWADDGEHKMSKMMRHYIAGQMLCLPYILPMFAPFVNSYKRYVPGSWAPTAACWGIENRTVPLRVIPTNSSAIRLETRIAGADSNPYLVIAACLASGLYGIENELELSSETIGDAYQNEDLKMLPNSLDRAIEAMETSEIPRALFEKSFVDHFLRTRRWEWNQFKTSVTDWERKRYFEIV